MLVSGVIHGHGIALYGSPVSCKGYQAVGMFVARVHGWNACYLGYASFFRSFARGIPSGKRLRYWKITMFNGEINDKWQLSIAS